ncbi:MAG TPA: hypothetical protein VMH39_05230 [Gemmatimonadaceae bacterium]|nr:hypothetical protein [Gemmatimonadaceae bacterium]
MRSRAWIAAAALCGLPPVAAFGQTATHQPAWPVATDTGAGRRRVTTTGQVPLLDWPSDEAETVRLLPAGAAVFLTDSGATITRDSGYVVALDGAEMKTKHGLFIVPTGSMLRVLADTGVDLSLAYRSGEIEITGMVSRDDVDDISRARQTWLHVKTADGAEGFVLERLVRKP